MFWNYITMSWRNLLKNKINSVINIVGLTLGLACCLLIMFFLKSELSYDKFYPKADRIYRITNENLDEKGLHWAVVSPVHALEIQKDIPEIEMAGRFSYAYKQVMSSTDGDEVLSFQEDHVYYADPQILDIFDFELLLGDPETALSGPNCMVVTESFAERYFPNGKPLGKIVTTSGEGRDHTVTGVIQDLPYNTSLSFDCLISMSTLYDSMEQRGAADWMESRGWAHFFTYVLLNENASIETARQKMPTFAENFYSEWFDDKTEVHDMMKLHLQPLLDIHLKSQMEQEMSSNGNIVYVYVFAFIVVLVMLLAGVNFVNISTARAFKRMREVGVRKALGAHRKDLMFQFLTESLLQAMVAAILAVILVELSIPFYQSITGLDISIMQILELDNILLLVVPMLIFGLFAGLYPAMFMSNFNTLESLKGQKNPSASVSGVRNLLVIFQFVISVFMIFSTIIIYQQMSYFQRKNLGFDSDQIVAIDMYGDLYRSVMNKREAVKSELLDYSSIGAVTLSSNIPGERFSVEDIRHDLQPKDVEVGPIRYIRVDEDFIETMGLTMIDGTSFKNWSSDNPAFILNETAARIAQIPDPIGKIATNFRETEAEIIGIVKDFNFASLQSEIEGLVIEYNPRWSSKLLIKITDGEIPRTMEFLEKKVQELAPGAIFNYTFLDDRLERLYDNERRLHTIMQVFAVLAIIISGLGLFGLSTYYAELRIKEVGIRKVYGASVMNISSLLTSKFVLWVIIANVIALPVAWWAMMKWLQNFAYRIDISPIAFILAFALSIVVAILTVSYRTIRAALENPVKALKYE